MTEIKGEHNIARCFANPLKIQRLSRLNQSVTDKNLQNVK